MEIVVVIPNWNGSDMIAQCLRSVLAQTQKTDIVVVDNGSVDASIAIIEKDFPSVHLIKLPINTGFSGGVNRGIEYALKHRYDAIALLNNDATADKHWLKYLVDELQTDDSIGIVTSKIMKADKVHLDSTGDFYNTWGTATPRGRDTKDTGKYDTREEVFGGSGGASLYRAELFRDIGIFDEDFFAYYEDVDISFRARLVGWKVIYEPGALVYHEVGATSGKIHGFATYHGLKNIFFLSYKNLPLVLLVWQFPKRLVYYTALHAYTWLRGKPGASISAIFKILILLPKKTVERWKIQKDRKISISELNKLTYHSLPASTKRKLGIDVE